MREKSYPGSWDKEVGREVHFLSAHQTAQLVYGYTEVKTASPTQNPPVPPAQPWLLSIALQPCLLQTDRWLGRCLHLQST